MPIGVKFTGKPVVVDVDHRGQIMLQFKDELLFRTLESIFKPYVGQTVTIDITVEETPEPAE